MAASAQAASFIGAVLEQAGYMAQADILRTFRSFFREAGAFVYILGAVGGLISFVVFGSYRAARYLLLGPALYWFLVGPTFNYDGVIWQVGNDAARGLNGARGEGASKQDVNEVLRRADIPSKNANIEVAYGFALFVRMVNSVSREVTELVTNASKDEEYLRFGTKGLALDSLMQIQINDPSLINMLEGDFYAKCPQAYAYSVSAAQTELRTGIKQYITNQGRAVADRRKAHYEEKAKEYLESHYMNPGVETKMMMVARGDLAADQINDTISITCGEMWKLIGAKMEETVKTPTQYILNVARGDNTDEEEACQKIIQKISKSAGGGGGCKEKLERAVAMMMLKNSVYDRRAGSRFINRIISSFGESAIPKDVRDMLEQGKAVTALSEARRASLIKMGNNLLAHPANGGVGEPINGAVAILAIKEAEIAAGKYGNDTARIDRERFVARSLAKYSAMVGNMDAGLTEYPKLHLRSLRQQLFTWAMNLPYWQGVILYLLSVAYPFMALVVLLPGRAIGFLNMPLAWLWIKSWDVGIAFVMLMEKVLWNLIPSLQWDNAALGGSLASRTPWEQLSEAQKFDHTWNLHIYYIVLSMVTLSIPAVTGYATLRARRSVLASFTEKLQADAKDAGQLASGMYGTNIMAERTKAQNELQAFAASIAGRNPEDGMYGNARVPKVDENGKPVIGADGKPVFESKYGERDAISRPLATQMALATLTHDAREKIIAAGAQSWSKDELSKVLTARLGAGPEVQKAVLAYQQTYRESMIAVHDMQQKELEAFHPILGRYGTVGMANIAYLAAVDGFGGYEMDPSDVTPVDSMIKLHNFQFQTRAKIAHMLLEGMPDIGVGHNVPGVGFSREIADDYIRNYDFKPDTSTFVGKLLALGQFEARNTATSPTLLERAEGDPRFNQGSYNAELASYKDLYEGKRNKKDGTPVSEREYKASLEYHRDLNDEMTFWPDGATHMEVGPGRFIRDVPEWLERYMHEGQKNGVIYNLTPDRRDPNFYDSNKFYLPKTETPKRKKDNQSSKNQEPKTHQAYMRDLEEDWVSDLLDDEKKAELRLKRLNGVLRNSTNPTRTA